MALLRPKQHLRIPVTAPLLCGKFFTFVTMFPVSNHVMLLDPTANNMQTWILADTHTHKKKFNPITVNILEWSCSKSLAKSLESLAALESKTWWWCELVDEAEGLKYKKKRCMHMWFFSPASMAVVQFCHWAPATAHHSPQDSAWNLRPRIPRLVLCWLQVLPRYPHKLRNPLQTLGCWAGLGCNPKPASAWERRDQSSRAHLTLLAPMMKLPFPPISLSLISQHPWLLRPPWSSTIRLYDLLVTTLPLTLQ